MKNIEYYIPLTILIASLLSSCSLFEEKVEASGEMITEELEMQDIGKISIADGFDVVYIHQKGKRYLSLTTDKAYREYINTDVDGSGGISISKASEISFSDDELTTITIYRDSLSSLTVTGGSEIMADSIFSTDLAIKLSGGSTLEATCKTIKLDIYLSGGSDAELAGKARNASLELNGGSELEAEDLICRNVSGSLSGGSEALITVNDSLDIQASGGSTFRYEGNPKELKQSVNGGSTVEKN
jgi:hypothetical protein